MERRRSRTRWSQLRLCTLGAQKPQMWRGGEGGREGGREGGEFSRSYTTGVPLSMAMDTAYPGWCSSSAQRPGAQTWCLTRNPQNPPISRCAQSSTLSGVPALLKRREKRHRTHVTRPQPSAEAGRKSGFTDHVRLGFGRIVSRSASVATKSLLTDLRCRTFACVMMRSAAQQSGHGLNDHPRASSRNDSKP